MTDKITYRLPFVLMLVVGIYMVAQYYIPHPTFQAPVEKLLQWKQPLNAYIILLALTGVVTMHAKRIIQQKKRWGYSVITLVSMAAMIFVGMVYGQGEGSVFSQWFKYLISPIESTMFSLLAFFVASAAFRAFRARTVGATILLSSATIVLLGLIPAVENICPFFSDASSFILKYPNTASKRAILIGVSLGAISVALKNIFGIDRTLLERSK